MLKFAITSKNSWIKPNFIFVKIVGQNFHQRKLDYIVRCVNQIWTKQGICLKFRL